VGLGRGVGAVASGDWRDEVRQERGNGDGERGRMEWRPYPEWRTPARGTWEYEEQGTRNDEERGTRNEERGTRNAERGPCHVPSPMYPLVPRAGVRHPGQWRHSIFPRSPSPFPRPCSTSSRQSPEATAPVPCPSSCRVTSDNEKRGTRNAERGTRNAEQGTNEERGTRAPTLPASPPPRSLSPVPAPPATSARALPVVAA